MKILKRKLREVEEGKNEGKRQISRLEVSNMQKETTISAITFKLRKVEEGEKELVLKNKSMQTVRQQLKAVPNIARSKGMWGIFLKINEGVAEKYIGLVLDMQNFYRNCLLEGSL